jgi:hypothetical protein
MADYFQKLGCAGTQIGVSGYSSMAHVTSLITQLARLTGHSLCKVSLGPANMSDVMDSSIVAVSSGVTRFFGAWDDYHNDRP